MVGLQIQTKRYTLYILLYLTSDSKLYKSHQLMRYLDVK